MNCLANGSSSSTNDTSGEFCVTNDPIPREFIHYRIPYCQ